MNEDWLAAWDAASEDERRVVIDRVLAIGPRWFVVAAHRDGGTLVVGVCTYHAQTFAAQSGSDYDRGYVDVGEIRVEAGAARYDRLLEHEEQFPENGAPDDEGWARGIVERDLAQAVAIRTVTQACEASGPMAWGPKIGAWPVVEEGGLRLVGVCWSYRTADRQVIGIDEIALDGIHVVGDTALLCQRVDVPDPASHDDQQVANGLIKAFMAREPRHRCVPQRR